MKIDAASPAIHAHFLVYIPQGRYMRKVRTLTTNVLLSKISSNDQANILFMPVA